MRSYVYKEIFLPSNLEIEKVVAENPPVFKFNIDYLKYICSYIYTKKVCWNEDEDFTFFTEVSSTNLKNTVSNYTLYIDYLIENKILQTDNHFIASASSSTAKCKGYRFHSTISSSPKIDRVVTYTLVKNINRYHDNAFVRARSTHGNLVKWFDPERLKIDTVKAAEITEKLYQSDLLDEKRQANALERKIINEIKVHKIVTGSYYLNTDDNVGRFHTNITTLKREHRKCLTYDDKKLVNVDIKNSQPLLVLVLLNPMFYKGSKYSEHFNIYKLIDRNPKLSLGKELMGYYNGDNNIRLINVIVKECDIMFREYEQRYGTSGIQRYRDLVLNGKFYEDFMDELVKNGIETGYSRDKTKTCVLKIMYSDNRYQSDEKRIFNRKHFQVCQIFKILKRQNKSILARLLQAIESYMVLDRVCKRISLESPKMPIFTIHDSILTTEGNEEYVESVLKDEFIRLLEFKPNVNKSKE
jgi:hypothetical protein